MPHVWPWCPNRRPLTGSPNCTLSSMMTQMPIVIRHTPPMRVMICAHSHNKAYTNMQICSHWSLPVTTVSDSNQRSHNEVLSVCIASACESLPIEPPRFSVLLHCVTKLYM